MTVETEPTDSLALANRLRPVLLQLARNLRRETHALGITGGQASILGAIHGHPGIGVNALAAQEGMAAASISGHIDRLEDAGLVERERAGSGDRRRVGLRVTRSGARALEGIRKRRTAWLAQRLESLDPAELERIAAAVDGLARIPEAPR
ncbi:MAG TPA: MarR family transcriptional regulator [Candidatus Dormibacteraeota bacterium]|jgi:DNA-binding MarR family transcriptional regulator|nr:MarR family transcriptional regulator [Candidatus Dormibacteraeota bacterium]